jgi:branched-chain amino acid transport system ATP-binding protein
MALLELQQIDSYYGPSQVLWQVSLSVGPHEVVSVVGSNGAGKTTLLRSISGLHPVTSGSISWKGQRIENIPPHRIVEYGISQIPEGGGIFPHMTVLENLRTGAYSKKNWCARARNLDRVFAMFPRLEERRQQLAGTLSGGERQMLGIGKGLMSCPELLILDEPSSGLSPKLVLLLFEVIGQIFREGIAVLLVEQNVHHALQMANRAYVMESGRLIKEGTSQALLADGEVKRAYLGM